MRLYRLSPAATPGGATPIRATDLIADMVAVALRPHEDPTVFGLWTTAEVTRSGIRAEFAWGEVRAVRLSGRGDFRAILAALGDPDSGRWMLIRSLATARSAFFAYDGQVFLCLTHDDPPPLATSLAVDVAEVSDALSGTPLMDGLNLSPLLDRPVLPRAPDPADAQPRKRGREGQS